MDNNAGLSASDVALLNGHNSGDMWGSNSMMWIFALLILAGGGFNNWGGGFNNAIGYENLATQAQVDRGFDTQNMIANQRETLAAVNGVVRYPNSTAYFAGNNPFCNCNSTM